MKYRVAYDISVLGISHFNQRSRTGIFRVIDENLKYLLQIGNLDLTLTSCRAYWEMAAALQFVQHLYPKHTEQFSLPFPPKSYTSLIYKAEKKLVDFNWKRTTSRTLINKVARKFSTFPIERLFPPQLQFTDIDLFHFPFFKVGNLEFTQSKPCIFTMYDLIPIKFPQYFKYRESRHLSNAIARIRKDRDYVICISEATKQDFCEISSMNPDRVFVVPLAASEAFYPVVDDATIALTTQKYQIPKSPYILSLATLEPRKNLDFLVRGFLRYIQETHNQDTCLVLVGTLGWKYDRIFESLPDVDPKLRSRIILTGYIPDEDLSAIYSGASVFAYPSLYEGFGLPPLEAMQCGTPVITSNTSSLPEVVGEAGIMIDPHQEDELCQALSKVLNSTELRIEMSQKSLQRASQFSWKKCAEQTAEVYQIAINNSSK
ncbi:glycosyltransferase family 4 protein [Phormidesmis sp. 146-35]